MVVTGAVVVVVTGTVVVTGAVVVVVTGTVVVTGAVVVVVTGTSGRYGCGRGGLGRCSCCRGTNRGSGSGHYFHRNHVDVMLDGTINGLDICTVIFITPLCGSYSYVPAAIQPL